MNTTLVVNPKGGSGKTTIAINLASRFAADGIPTTLMDYDPQGSSLHWLHLRDRELPRIHGASGAPEKFGRLRSFEMYVPPQTRELIIDAPAGASGLLLQNMLARSQSVIVPIVASPIDIHATGHFIKELLSRPRSFRLGVVANKVRVSMPAYQPLLRFLESLGIQPLARLLDSDVYLRAAETGVGIFELEQHHTQAERQQFEPIVQWVWREQSGVHDADEVTPIRRVAF
jgi:chromosome partitioning protein